MRLGIILPQDTWDEFRGVAEAAEASDLDSVWVADHFGMQEAWTMLTAVAAVTTRVQLGTLVLCATFRGPGLVANMAATLDQVAGGRLILGVGCGCDEAEHQTFGLPTAYRVSRFAEWLEIVVRLLRAETVTLDGSFHRVHEARIEPTPERTVPVFVAAGGPRMRELAATWADARLAAWYGVPSEAVQAEGTLPAYVGAVIRDPKQPPVERAEPYAVAGPVEEVADVLAEYAALGVEHLVVLPEPITIRSVERLAEAWRLARTTTPVDRGQLTE